MIFIFLSFVFLFLTLIAPQTMFNKADTQVKLCTACRTAFTMQARKWAWQPLWNIKRFISKIFTPKNLQFKTSPIRIQRADEFLNAVLSLEGESIRR